MQYVRTASCFVNSSNAMEKRNGLSNYNWHPWRILGHHVCEHGPTGPTETQRIRENYMGRGSVKKKEATGVRDK